MPQFRKKPVVIDALTAWCDASWNMSKPERPVPPAILIRIPESWKQVLDEIAAKWRTTPHDLAAIAIERFILQENEGKH